MQSRWLNVLGHVAWWQSKSGAVITNLLILTVSILSNSTSWTVPAVSKDALQLYNADLECILVSFFHFTSRCINTALAGVLSLFWYLLPLYHLAKGVSQQTCWSSVTLYMCFWIPEQWNWWQSHKAQQMSSSYTRQHLLIFKQHLPVHYIQSILLQAYGCKGRKAEPTAVITTHEGANSPSPLAWEQVWTVRFERPFAPV